MTGAKNIQFSEGLFDKQKAIYMATRELELLAIIDHQKHKIAGLKGYITKMKYKPFKPTT